MKFLLTPRTQCFTYKELKAIRGEDNGEPLVNLRETTPRILLGPGSPKMTPYVGNGMFVRKNVHERLVHADNLLRVKRPGARLKVMYAYRHPEVQKGNFDAFFLKSREQFPEMGEEALFEYVHHYMAIPDVGGHPTGGAVDLTFVEGSAEADMGAAMADFSDMSKVPVFSTSISESHMENRILLREVMMQAGFAPYDFEWWHFSYGEREWACFYEHEATLYDTLEFSNIQKEEI